MMKSCSFIDGFFFLLNFSIDYLLCYLDWVWQIVSFLSDTKNIKFNGFATYQMTRIYQVLSCNFRLKNQFVLVGFITAYYYAIIICYDLKHWFEYQAIEPLKEGKENWLQSGWGNIWCNSWWIAHILLAS